MEPTDIHTVSTKAGHRLLIHSHQSLASTEMELSTSDPEHSQASELTSGLLPKTPNSTTRSHNSKISRSVAYSDFYRALKLHCEPSDINVYLELVNRIPQPETVELTRPVLRILTALIDEAPTSTSTITPAMLVEYTLITTDLCSFIEESIKEIEPHLKDILRAYTQQTGELYPIENIRSLKDVASDSLTMYDIHPQWTFEHLSRLQILSFTVRSTGLTPLEIISYGKVLHDCSLRPTELEKYLSLYEATSSFISIQELDALAHLSRETLKKGAIEAEVTACCSLKLKTLGTMLTANEIKVFEQALHENSRRKHLKNALFEAAHMVYSIIQTSFTRTHLCFLLPLMQSSTDPHEIVSADQVCRFISSELEKPPHRDCSNELLEEILSQARTLYPEYGNKILGQLDFRNALSRVVIKFGSLHSNQLSTSNIRDLAVALDAISQSRERLFCSLSSLVASLSYPAKAAETLEQFLSSYGRFFSTPPTDDREALYQRIIIDNKDIRSLEDIVEVLEAVSEFLFTQGLDPKSITRITIKE